LKNWLKLNRDIIFPLDFEWFQHPLFIEKNSCTNQIKKQQLTNVSKERTSNATAFNFARKINEKFISGF